LNFAQPPARNRHAPAPSAPLARILRRMPQEIRSSFTPEQLAALDVSLDHHQEPRHTINLRVTLFGRAYVALFAGRERRSPARRARERQRHPLASPGNIAFLLGVSLLGLAAGIGLHALILGS